MVRLAFRDRRRESRRLPTSFGAEPRGTMRQFGRGALRPTRRQTVTRFHLRRRARRELVCDTRETARRGKERRSADGLEERERRRLTLCPKSCFYVVTN